MYYHRNALPCYIRASPCNTQLCTHKHIRASLQRGPLQLSCPHHAHLRQACEPEPRPHLPMIHDDCERRVSKPVVGGARPRPTTHRLRPRHLARVLGFLRHASGPLPGHPAAPPDLGVDVRSLSYGSPVRTEILDQPIAIGRDRVNLQFTTCRICSVFPCARVSTSALPIVFIC
jgi:hypothetical protein